MKKSKLIAIAIFLFIYFVPFRMCFFTDEIVQGAKFAILIVVNVVGFLIAFGIGTNEPFDRKIETSNEHGSHKSESRKAA